MPNSRAIDETGNEYGLWLVVGRAPTARDGSTPWYCQCACGSPLKIVSAGNLRRGVSLSCGCRRKAHCGNPTHGMTGHPAYVSYKSAKTRCTNKKSTYFHNYGGRGVEFRLPAFPEFWAEMEKTWWPGATLDRKRSAGHYEMGNVRWASRQEQADNKTNNINLTLNGVTKNVSAWARELGIKRTTLAARVKKGWSDFDALTLQVKQL